MKLAQEIWVLESPDNGHWDSKFAREELTHLAKKWDLILSPTYETRDTGFGQERKFIIEGEEENVLAFEEELDEVLY